MLFYRRRDFNRTHGRPVMKEEDIHPVANEYQRYKVHHAYSSYILHIHNHRIIMQELKQLIKESKSN